MARDALSLNFSDLRETLKRGCVRFSGTAGREKNDDRPATASPAAKAA